MQTFAFPSSHCSAQLSLSFSSLALIYCSLKGSSPHTSEKQTSWQSPFFKSKKCGKKCVDLNDFFRVFIIYNLCSFWDSRPHIAQTSLFLPQPSSSSPPVLPQSFADSTHDRGFIMCGFIIYCSLGSLPLVLFSPSPHLHPRFSPRASQTPLMIEVSLCVILLSCMIFSSIAP